MTDNTENLILEHLKRFQAGQDRIESKLDELTRRIANLEAGQASLTYMSNIAYRSSGVSRRITAVNV
jgi:hypothetical protein